MQCSKYSIWGKGLTLLHSESAIWIYTDNDDLYFSTMTLRMAMLSAKGLKIHRHPFEHLSQNIHSHLTLSIFLTLCMLGNTSCFCCYLLYSFKIIFKKKFFQEHYQCQMVWIQIRTRDWQNVRPDLGPNSLQITNVIPSKEGVKKWCLITSKK